MVRAPTSKAPYTGIDGHYGEIFQVFPYLIVVVNFLKDTLVD
jgi:hypothetical protein